MVLYPAFVATVSTVASLGGEGWRQIGELALASLLSSLIGLERELRQKSAGLRTHTLVGVGAALFMFISKYGFGDVLVPGQIVLDPSRVAAQIVTGIGFLGAGLIFVHRGSVRGLTTAAAVWVTAAIGAAAAAGLPILAAVTTLIYFVVTMVFPTLMHRLPSRGLAASVLRVRYLSGSGVLRQVLALTTKHSLVVDQVTTRTIGQVASTPVGHDAGAERDARQRLELTLHLHGPAPASALVAAIEELDGVESVSTAGTDETEE